MGFKPSSNSLRAHVQHTLELYHGLLLRCLYPTFGDFSSTVEKTLWLWRNARGYKQTPQQGLCVGGWPLAVPEWSRHSCMEIMLTAQQWRDKLQTFAIPRNVYKLFFFPPVCLPPISPSIFPQCLSHCIDALKRITFPCPFWSVANPFDLLWPVKFKWKLWASLNGDYWMVILSQCASSHLCSLLPWW